MGLAANRARIARISRRQYVDIHAAVKGAFLPSSSETQIAKRIKQIREALGSSWGKRLPQAELARRLGVDKKTVYRWEVTGAITVSNARALAELAGCDVEWLLTGRGHGPGRAGAGRVAEPRPESISPEEDELAREIVSRPDAFARRFFDAAERIGAPAVLAWLEDVEQIFADRGIRRPAYFAQLRREVADRYGGGATNGKTG